MPKTVSVTLEEALEEFVARKVSEGVYPSAEAMIKMALQHLEEEAKRREALRDQLQAGEESPLLGQFEPQLFHGVSEEFLTGTYCLRSAVQKELEAVWADTARRWDEEQADLYLQAFFKRFVWLAEFPLSGLIRDDVKSGYRSFPEGMHRIFYIIRETCIEIVGVVHQRLDDR